ncbi:CHASE2 domain-containing protein [Persephonella sp.]
MNVFKVFLFLLLFLIFLLLYFSKPVTVTKFINSLEDIKFSIESLLDIHDTPYENIVVVTIDEESINKYGRWPWNRKITAKLIENLKEAKVVGLDIVFSERSDPESDEALFQAIGDAGNVISGFFFRDYSTETIPEEIIDYLEDCSLPRYKLLSEKAGIHEFSHIESNLPEILENSLSCAFFNIKPDADGIYRHYPTVYLFKGMIFPSLALQLVRFYLNKEIDLEISEKGVRKLSISNKNINRNYIRINFYKDIKTVSAKDVLEKKVTSDFFKDKIVIVGITEMGVYDIRPTPIDPLTPGVFLHFMAVSNILNGEFLKSSTIYDIGFTFSVMFLVFLATFIKKLKFRMPIYGMVLLIPLLLSSTLLITFDIWLVTVYPFVFSFMYIIILEIFQYFKVDVQTKELKKAFSKYVSPEIVDQIVKNPEKLGLGGDEKDITVLFADIRNFTSITEKLTPHQIVTLLNIYFDKMTEIILKNKGLLDKYIGDAIMAVFNAPLSVQDHPDKACETAILMTEELKNINRILSKKGLPPIRIGIGINTGNAVIGNLGSSFRFEYTAIGDTVNLASRLESLNRIYGTSIIVSHYTVEKVKKRFLFRKIDKVKVKGKEEAVIIYELMEESLENKTIKDLYEKALELYFNAKFEQAEEIFSKLWTEFEDQASKVLADRSKMYVDNPPESNWNGIYEFKEK